MKIVFMGTPEFAVPVLESLINEYKVSLVVTQPDKEVGRKRILTPSPIKEVALKNNIEVFQPKKIREDYQKIVDLQPNLIITCSYGQIIPKEILDCPKLGCINVHASLLPRLRGGAPLQHAIIDGEKESGITIMYMDEHMDTGDIISTIKYELKSDETYKSLHDTLSPMGAKLLMDTLPSIINGTNPRTKQDEEEATYAYTIKREEERIDFNKSVTSVDNLVRGLFDHPYANFTFNGEEHKIVKGHFEKKDNTTPGKIVIPNKKSMGIECADGIYFIDNIKPFGKKEMDITSYLNGLNIEDFNGKIVNC